MSIVLRMLMRQILAILFILCGTLCAEAQIFPPTQPTQCVANVLAGGTPDAITTIALPCALTTNLLLLTIVSSNVTSTPTLQPLGLPAQVIVRSGGGALNPGDLIAGGQALLTPTGGVWVLLNPRTNVVGTINVLDFGMKCDGSTDDTVALDAAVQAAT